MKSPKWKYILYIIFAAIAFISTKRTILIATILSGVLFFLKTKRGKESLALVILFVIIFSFSPLSKDIIANTSDRFLSIGEDGGSGRNTLYFQIWTDISSNYSTQDILVGKGFSSVSHLVGMDAHMDILQILHSLGFIGLIIYLTIYIIILYKLKMYKNIVDYNDHLGLITFITFICFVIVANMNCFIFNPSFSVPMFFSY